MKQGSLQLTPSVYSMDMFYHSVSDTQHWTSNDDSRWLDTPTTLSLNTREERLLALGFHFSRSPTVMTDQETSVPNCALL